MKRAFLAAGSVALFFAACVADEPDTSGNDANDAGSDATSVSDASPTDGAATTDAPSGPCDPTKAFGTAIPLDALNTINGSAAVRLSANGLNAYYDALAFDGGSSIDLYQASRATTAVDFSAPVDIYSQYGATVVGAPTITGDGLNLYYAYVSSQAVEDVTIALLTRPVNTVPFDAKQPFLPVGDPVDSLGDGGFTVFNTDPYILPDGHDLYFSSDRLEHAGFDIFSAQSIGDGGFTALRFYGELGTQHSARSPAVSPDGLLIYFASQRETDGGKDANWSVYRASRSTTSAQFGNVTRVDELTIDQDTFPDFITPDLCTIYFHRQGSLTSLLYRASRAP